MSTSLIYAENTRAFISALPAASRTLFGCQSTLKTVERMGFLRRRDTHQSPSGSKEQIAMALVIHEDPIDGDELRDIPGTTCDSKLVFVRTPTHKGSSAVDTQKYKCRLPHHVSSLRIGTLLPDIRISVLRRRDDAVGLGSPVDGRDRLVMLSAPGRELR